MSGTTNIYSCRIALEEPRMRKRVTRVILSIGCILSIAIAGSVGYYLTENRPRNEENLTTRKTEKLVIDTDAGSDDATAILLILSAWARRHSNFDVIGITCVYGNTYEHNVETNVLKTLTIANSSQIPVYGGTVKPLTASTFTADNYFGEDGLGDFVFDREIIAKVDKSKHAAIALVELAKKHKGELNLLLLGPLTNVAVAIALDPEFLNNVKKIYIMGGCYLGKGNRSPGVEYNFSHDPESNFVVFNSTKEIVLLPWEAALHAKISIDWRKDVLGTIQSDYMDFLNKAEKKVLNGPTWTSADTMMAAAMIWPNLATKKLSTNVTPITDGAARGGVLVDFGEPPEKSINTEIIEELDVEEFKKLLVYYLSN